MNWFLILSIAILAIIVLGVFFSSSKDEENPSSSVPILEDEDELGGTDEEGEVADEYEFG